MEKKKIGFVLSGGSVRGFAHVGVLKRLEEEGIKADIVSGASMGAIIGAFYCNGLSAEEMWQLLKKEQVSRAIRWKIGRKGLMNLTLPEKLLKHYIPHNSFEKLQIPLAVSVTNLTKGQNEIIRTGNLSNYVLASASIPILFKPKYINGDFYVDGGLTDNMPVAAIRNECKYVLGIHVNYMNQDRQNLDSFRDIGERCFRIAVYKTVRKGMKLCDWIVDPPETRNYKAFDFNRFEEIIDIGYHAVDDKTINEIKKKLNINS